MMVFNFSKNVFRHCLELAKTLIFQKIQCFFSKVALFWSILQKTQSLQGFLKSENTGFSCFLSPILEIVRLQNNDRYPEFFQGGCFFLSIWGVFLSGPDPKKFPPAAVQNHVLDVFEAKNFPHAAGIQQSGLQWVFTSVGTHLCYSQKRFSVLPRAATCVFTSVGSRFYYSQKWFSSRADAVSDFFTSVWTRFYHS